MRRFVIFVALAGNLTIGGALIASEPAKIDPRQVVGRVYGKSVTAADVGLTEPIDTAIRFDATDRARWALMGRIQSALGGPILRRFVDEKKLAATPEEIAQFRRVTKRQNEKNIREWEARVAELRQASAKPDLADDRRTKLRQELAMYEKFLDNAPRDDGSDELARMFILPWKTERELHRTYGGRIIFQQFGLEALDARRLLFEEAEKRGDLKFDDAGVRHLFYYYANMRHVTTDDPQALEIPWFFSEEKERR